MLMLLLKETMLRYIHSKNLQKKNSIIPGKKIHNSGMNLDDTLSFFNCNEYLVGEITLDSLIIENP